MNNIVKMHVLIGASLAFLVIVTGMGLLIWAFPFSNWSLLWERQIGELPFIIVLPAVTLLIGAIAGMMTGVYWRKQLLLMENAVDDIRQGQPLRKQAGGRLKELDGLGDKMKILHQQSVNQAKLVQKLTNERVENQEEQLQKVVSDERNRLARELHDSVSQELFAASMMISALNEMSGQLPDLTKKQLGQVEMMVQQSQLEMRALLLHLRPAALKDKTLRQGMEQLLEELRQKVPLDISWRMDDVDLERGIEDHLFRILQEAVSNTLRHAKASTLDILLLERDGFVILRMMDDGVGFDVAESMPGSYGLQNMRERAEEVGGQVKIISIPGKGTRLEVKVPIIYTEDEEND